MEQGLIRNLGAAHCHAAWIIRALSRSSFARPDPWRLTSFKRVMSFGVASGPLRL